jgi:hypothetical protein
MSRLQGGRACIQVVDELCINFASVLAKGKMGWTQRKGQDEEQKNSQTTNKNCRAPAFFGQQNRLKYRNRPESSDIE